MEEIGFLWRFGHVGGCRDGQCVCLDTASGLNARSGAVVMSSSVVVKSTPNESGTDLFVLHEGTRVEIIDDSMKEWKEIRLADGKVGWMPTEAMEVI